MTVGNVISRVRQSLNSVRLDDRIPAFFIYLYLISKAEFFIKRDSDKKKIFNNLTTLTKEECVELEDAPLGSCSNLLFSKCKTIKRTSKKIPNPYLSNTLLPIIAVTSIDDSSMFYPTNPFTYSKILDREFKGNEKYFWYENEYLYIPDENLQYINIRGYFKTEISHKRDNVCFTFLDSLFDVPSYLLDIIIDETVKGIYTYYKRSIVDEDSNLNTNDKQ